VRVLRQAGGARLSFQFFSSCCRAAIPDGDLKPGECLSILSQLLLSVYICRPREPRIVANFQFFPSCCPLRRAAHRGGEALAALSILSQLLLIIIFSLNGSTWGQSFNSFPVAAAGGILAARRSGTSSEPFNSFPVAATATGCARRPATSTSFNSFPVAAKAMSLLGLDAVALDFQFFPSCCFSRFSLQSSQLTPPFNSFPVAAWRM